MLCTITGCFIRFCATLMCDKSSSLVPSPHLKCHNRRIPNGDDLTWFHYIVLEINNNNEIYIICSKKIVHCCRKLHFNYIRNLNSFYVIYHYRMFHEVLRNINVWHKVSMYILLIKYFSEKISYENENVTHIII